MIDWQGYLDGALSPVEKTAIDARLANEPQLQRELEGFKAFRETLGSAGRQVAAPVDALDSMLREVAKPKRPGWLSRYRWLQPALAMAALLILVVAGWAVLVGNDPMNLAKSPVKESKANLNASDAANWIQMNTGIHAPVLKLAPTEKIMQEVSYGDGWARYKFLYCGREVDLQMSVGDEFDKHAQIEPRQGKPTLFEGPKGYGWRSGGVSYYFLKPKEGCGTALNEICDQTVRVCKPKDKAQVASDKIGG